MKPCTKCHEIKSLSEFYNNKSKEDGRSSFCRTCNNKDSKKYRENNKEKVLVILKKYRENNKEKVLECQRKYRRENSDKIKKYDKKFREEHREEIRKAARKYQEGHREEMWKARKAWLLKLKSPGEEKRYKVYLDKKHAENKKYRAKRYYGEFAEANIMLNTLIKEINNERKNA